MARRGGEHASMAAMATSLWCTCTVGMTVHQRCEISSCYGLVVGMGRMAGMAMLVITMRKRLIWPGGSCERPVLVRHRIESMVNMWAATAHS